VSCGLYLTFLLALSAGCIAGAARGLRAWVGERPTGAEPVEVPWWVGVVAVVVGLVLTVVCVVIVKFALELVEYLAFAWRQCPNCGARRWSWGFTRGFGM
jgi:hypothetical protein